MDKALPTKLSCLITSGIEGRPEWEAMASGLAEIAIYLDPPEPPTLKGLLGIGIRITAEGGAFGIVNSDIKLSNKILGIAGATRSLGRAWAATSFRWEYSGDEIAQGLDKVEGQGIDIFIMTPAVAKYAFKEIPDFLTLGRGGWDNWMCGWMNKNLGDRRFVDFTHWRCVHHKRHPSGSGRFASFTKEQTEQITHNVSPKGIPSSKLTYPL